MMFYFFFSSRRRHTRLQGDWSSDVCSSDLGLALNGTTAAGPQTVSLSVGHIQPAGATRITGASAKVSVNDGHTFRAARVTSQGGGRFLVRFTAPAGAAVTLRVSATDAAGGSISETILRGYGVAP